VTDATSRLAAALAGRYHLESELGSGGMATVYLARDLKHDRSVAVKVLRPDLAAVPVGERFLSEIKITAGLDHPHILTLIDSGVAGDLQYFVMPYVRGETLRQLLAREQRLGTDTALAITRQIASALEYAHGRGVVHRDIKPENILFQEGVAILADFGIALAVEDTAGHRLTFPGRSPGTPQYMSPEQARGDRAIDARSDIYSLGAVLYEMLTGSAPALGATTQELLAHLTTGQSGGGRTHPATVPGALGAVVMKALARNPIDRYGSARELLEALDNAGTARARWASALWKGRYRVGVVAGVLAAAVLGVMLFRAGRRPVPEPSPVVLFDLEFDQEAQLSDAFGTPLALSADGSRLVYTGTDSAGRTWLYLRAIDRVDPIRLAGTEGGYQAFFSPDGRTLGFLQGTQLRRVSLDGSSIATMADLGAGTPESPARSAATMNGATWGPDDIIVFAHRGNLYETAAGGGVPRLVVTDTVAGGAIRWPDVLPGGRHVVVTIATGSGPQLATVDRRTATVTMLNHEGMSPRWVEQGYLVFTQSDFTVRAAPFDPRLRRFTGTPELVLRDVSYGPMMIGKMGIARESGAIAFLSGAGSNLVEVVTVDRTGGAAVIVTEGAAGGPRFSPDGRYIAFEMVRGWQNTDLWVFDRAAANLTRVTFDAASMAPEWTPDGRRLLYASRGDGRDHLALYGIAVDGNGTPELVLERRRNVYENALTSDGRALVFTEGVGPTRDIWVTSLDRPQEARALVHTSFNERQIALSPDGRWLAYVSDETGADEVYVRGLEEGGPRWRVSTAGGRAPRWGAKGSELLYRIRDSLFATAVAVGTEFRHERPRALLGLPGYHEATHLTSWDVSPAGDEFVFLRFRSGSVHRLRILLHWFHQPRGRRG
jgi:serine/threonine-protein kinase